jgi:hypothetical protein
MTRSEVYEGSVVDLLARIAWERSQLPEEPDQEPDVAEAPASAEKPIKPPTLLFPGAPRRRRRR